MSGIYIHGLEMPTNCLDCPVYWDKCPVWDTDGDEYLERIHPGCPLIPVPDHGGLVDKQKVVQKVYDYCHTADDKYCGPDDVGELWEEMKAMPTIIPADKEVEG